MSRLIGFFLLYLWTLPAIAQVLSLPISAPNFRVFDRNGEPLVAGKLYSYRAGTAIPLATYTHVSENTTNTNPVILDSEGAARIYLGEGTYKLVLQDQFGVVQWSVDNVKGRPPTSMRRSPYGYQTTGQRYPTILGISSRNSGLNASLASGSDIGAKINFLMALCAGLACSIYIPAGTYSFTTPIFLATNVELYGAGKYRTTLNYSGAANTTAITAGPSTTHVNIHDFQLKGPVEILSTPSSYNSLSGITILGDDTTIDSMAISHFWSGADIGLAGKNNTVSNSDLEYGKFGISLGGTYNTAKNNHISNHYSLAQTFEAPAVHYWDGIISEPASYALIEGNFVEDNGQSGIYEGGNSDISKGNRVISNTVLHNWNRGIDNGVTGDIGINGVFELDVSGNYLVDNLADNLWLVCVQHATVMGNISVYTKDYARFFGARLSKSRSGIVIADICGSASQDITKYVSVIGNSIFDYTGTALAGFNFNVKASSIGNTFIGNANNGNFFISDTVDRIQNTIMQQNTSPRAIGSRVRSTN